MILISVVMEIVLLSLQYVGSLLLMKRLVFGFNSVLKCIGSVSIWFMLLKEESEKGESNPQENERWYINEYYLFFLSLDGCRCWGRTEENSLNLLVLLNSCYNNLLITFTYLHSFLMGTLFEKYEPQRVALDSLGQTLLSIKFPLK